MHVSAAPVAATASPTAVSWQRDLDGMAGAPLITTRSTSQWRSPFTLGIPVSKTYVDEHAATGRGFGLVAGGIDAALAAARTQLGALPRETMAVGMTRDGQAFLADMLFVTTPYDTGWMSANNDWTPFRQTRDRSSIVDVHAGIEYLLERRPGGDVNVVELPTPR